MQAFVGSVSSIGTLAILGAMFVIVFVCVQKAVKEMRFFGDAAGWAVALCVTMLSIIGIVRFFGSPKAVASSEAQTREADGLLDFILLPYVALAAAVILVLLLSAVDKLRPGRKPQRQLSGRTKQRTIAKPEIRQGDHHQEETRSFVASRKQQITVPRNGKMIKKTEGGR